VAQQFVPNPRGIELVALEARRDLIDEVGEEATELMRAAAPEDTGLLKEKHSWEGVDPEGERGVIFFDVPYASYVHEGTAGHPIPNAFGWGITVQHPGYKGNPWARLTLDQMAAGAAF